MAIALGGMAAALVAVPLAAQRAQVVNAGSEQALRIGTVTVSRPFGGTLVDRLAVVGAYRIGRERLWLVRGDGGPACPARYVVVARRSVEEIVTSTPFGTCAAAGKPRVAAGALEVPFAGRAGASVRYAYRDGEIRLLDAARVARSVPVAPRCVPGAQVPAGEQAATLAAFEDGFPSSYGSERALRRADLSPAELRDLLTGLACLASWPAAQEVVPDRATALFASKRWGPRAFAMLDVIAEDRTTSLHLVALTRSFAAEMRYRVDRRTTI
ncbi:MAG: hypothetical protein ABW128_17540 [Rhizorhabdus sp.]